jgi:hypothetical protein
MDLRLSPMELAIIPTHIRVLVHAAFGVIVRAADLLLVDRLILGEANDFDGSCKYHIYLWYRPSIIKYR